MKKPIKQLFFSRTADFLHTHLPHSGSMQTVDAYTDALTVFRRYVTDIRGISLTQFTFDDCTFDLILDFRNWLLDEAGRAPATVNHRLAAIRAYLHFAAAEDVSLSQILLAVEDVPFAAASAHVGPIIESESAIRELLNAPPNTRTGRRDQTILSVLFDTAVRAQELTAMRICDLCLNGETPHVLVHGKGRKERITPLNDGSVALLAAFLEEFHAGSRDREFVFYTKIRGQRGRMSVRNVERIVKKYADIARKCGADLPEQVHPHMLRRTRGTLMYRDGVPIEMVATILGHTSIQTTNDHYVTASLQQKKEALEKGGAGTIVGPEENQIEWPDDPAELARLFGIR